MDLTRPDWLKLILLQQLFWAWLEFYRRQFSSYSRFSSFRASRRSFLRPQCSLSWLSGRNRERDFPSILNEMFFVCLSLGIFSLLKFQMIILNFLVCYTMIKCTSKVLTSLHSNKKLKQSSSDLLEDDHRDNCWHPPFRDRSTHPGLDISSPSIGRSHKEIPLLTASIHIRFQKTIF